MPAVKKNKPKVTRSTDPEKERAFKGLSSLLGSQGYSVRREELKRGPGWRASSGSCRKMDEKIVFVDKRSPIDEQVAFLVQEVINLDIVCDEAMLAALPEDLRGPVASALQV